MLEGRLTNFMLQYIYHLNLSVNFSLYWIEEKKSELKEGTFSEENNKCKYLNQELFPPIIEIVKWFHDIHIIDKHTTISTTVESNPETLKPFLSSCIPYLIIQRPSIVHERDDNEEDQR